MNRIETQPCVYKLTNKTNGRWFIGAASPTKKALQVSGTSIKKAIKKYGRDNFTKEIIAYCEKKHLPIIKEAMLYYYDAKNDKMSYNMKNTHIHNEKGMKMGS